MTWGIRSITLKTPPFGSASVVVGIELVRKKFLNTARSPPLSNLFHASFGKTPCAQNADTEDAPAAFKTCAHSNRVPPLCTKSSTMMMVLF